MGQRLNIEVVNNGDVLANAYYHWSAYTGSAIELVETALTRYDERNEDEDMIELAVYMLSETGAGFPEDELSYIESVSSFQYLPKPVCTDRNTGILSVTERGIDDTRRWEEGRVTIDIGCESVDFGIIWVDDEDSFNEGREDDCAFSNLPLHDFSAFNDVSFDDFYMIRDIVNEYPDGYVTSDGYAITWIQ